MVLIVFDARSRVVRTMSGGAAFGLRARQAVTASRRCVIEFASPTAMTSRGIADRRRAAACVAAAVRARSDGLGAVARTFGFANIVPARDPPPEPALAVSQ